MPTYVPVSRDAFPTGSERSTVVPTASKIMRGVSKGVGQLEKVHEHHHHHHHHHGVRALRLLVSHGALFSRLELRRGLQDGEGHHHHHHHSSDKYKA